MPIKKLAFSKLDHFSTIAKIVYNYETFQLTKSVSKFIPKRFMRLAPVYKLEHMHLLKISLMCIFQILQLITKRCKLHPYIFVKLNTAILRPFSFLFSSKLTNRPNKLECYITQGWKGLAR